MIIICAVDKNFGVGKNGRIPWKNKRDLQHFKEYTMGKTLLVGKKTILPPMNGRTVIVLERGPIIEWNDYVKNPENGKNNIHHPYNSDHILIGGPTVWREALHWQYVTEIIMTYIDGIWDCDTFFPKEYLEEFKEVERYTLNSETEVVKYIQIDSPYQRYYPFTIEYMGKEISVEELNKMKEV